MALEFISNSVLREDILSIINSDVPIEEYIDTRIMITGATGLIGSILVKVFASFNALKHTNMRIIALIREKNKAKRIFGELYDNPDIEFVESDILEGINYDKHVDYIFHTAAITTSKMMVEKPVETILTSIKGTNNVLSFAVDKNVQSVVYLSSMEMYGTFADSEIVTEEDLGYINPLSIRSDYPESKRMCENLCVAYVKQYGLNIKIARLAQTFGAGVLPEDNRVFVQFAKSVIDERDIVLHTEGESEVNCCYTSDCIRALLILCIRGTQGEAYNISNEEIQTSIANMAKLVAKIFTNNKIKVVFDIQTIDKFGYAETTRMKLSSKKMQSLGWKALIGLEESYKRLIDYMKDG